MQVIISGLLTLASVSSFAATITWTASSAGNASDANNWDLLRVPQTTDDIKIDTATGSMTWDAGVNGLPATVASWDQTLNYTGTVTFLTTYAEASPVFTNFTVTSNAVIQKGTWTHPSNSAEQVYHLQVAVGSNFTLGTSGKINVQGKGYAANKYPAGSGAGVHGGANGNLSQVYGNPYKPYDLGSGQSYAGGGAVWIEIAGTAVIDGTVNASAYDTSGLGNGVGSGAGGSVYIKAASLSGTGKFYSSANHVYTGKTGSGGRIAVELTSATALGIDTNNFIARGGCSSTSGGAGTIFIKTTDQTYGTLIVDNILYRTYGSHPPSKYGTTSIVSGETWTFDSIIIRNYGALSVPTGTTLNIPNGFPSVSSTNTSLQGGILYMGGTITPGGGTPYTFMSNWIFQADSPCVITGNVSVTNGGALGCIQFQNTLTSYAGMNLTVIGNLDVAADGRIYAVNSGVDYPSPNGTKGYHGGQSAADATDKTYDSVLNPTLPGGLAQSGDAAEIRGGGGAILLTVSSNLNVNGSISSTSTRGSYWPGAGGTINIRAGTLTGSGTIRANGGIGTSTVYSGGGGRVAVRLTDTNTFDAFIATNISACGVSYSSTNINYLSSAGTVYLQTAADGEGAGQVIIRNDNYATNTSSVTWFPSINYGGSNDVFRHASLSIEDYAIVKLSKSVSIGGGLTIKTNSIVDLNGYELRVMGMKTNGVPIPVGIYTATDFASCVIDSSDPDTGTICIANAGMLIIFR